MPTPRHGSPPAVDPAGATTAAIPGDRGRICDTSVERGASGYPRGLEDLKDPPRVVYMRGGPVPPPSSAVTIVGSRAASPYGLAQARRLAGDLARMGFVVVSGLARGIDAAAHRGALEAGGSTVAVLPGGLDDVTPRHHVALAGEIAARGTLLSEHAAGPPRSRGMFVKRNRLIAALAGATVVVEAAARSGALSTGNAAARIGRPVLAVPGDLDRETSRGCHALIKAGAGLCENAVDVAAAVDAWAGGRGEPRVRRPGPGPEARLLDVLKDAPLGVEALAAAAELSIAAALSGLLALQWAGVALALPGQRWARAGTGGSIR